MKGQTLQIATWVSVVFAALFGVGADAQTDIRVDSHGSPRFFVERQTFHPIGVNVLSSHPGPPYQSFSMFDVNLFDAAQLDRNLKEVKGLGYNYVRLWLKGYDPDSGFSLSSRGVSDGYVANVGRALELAKAHGLYVVLTGSFREGLWLPKNYLPSGLPSEMEVGGMNRLLLLPSMAQAVGDFYADLLRNLRNRDQSLLSSVLYFDLYNELHFDLSKAPFDRTAGVFSFDGRTYELSTPSGRQSLMDAAGGAWMRTVTASVHHVAPSVPVTVSTFPIAVFGHPGFDGGVRHNASHAEDPYPLRPQILLESGAQLLDIHVYSAAARGASPAFHMKAIQLLKQGEFTPELANRVPVVFGEFGSKDLTIEHADSSIPEMRATFSALCPLHPSGYAVWALNGDIGKQATGELELLRSFGSASPACSEKP